MKLQLIRGEGQGDGKPAGDLVDVRLEFAEGRQWHQLNYEFVERYHGGQPQWEFRFGFDFKLLTATELDNYARVYTRTMQDRGVKISFAACKRQLLGGAA